MKIQILALCVLAVAAPAMAADGAKVDPTYLDPKSAGLEYELQGEYIGKVDGNPVGVQVIALGGGKFHGILFPGGLPGAGYNDEQKIEADGELDGGKLVFHGKEGESRVTFSGGKAEGKTKDGAPFSLEKTVRHSPTEGAKAPSGAIVLFDGGNADAWVGPHVDQRKLLQSGCKTKQEFTDYNLHVEFILPFKPFARGQERGNSGVYMQDRYEIQVLDSFGLKGLNNECAGIYSKVAPSVNMCFPPLTWQTYDIDFTAARFDADGKKTKKAVVTVKHNGVTVHDHQEIDGPTGGGQPENSKPGAIQLQGHGNPVFYRNIWIVEKK